VRLREHRLYFYFDRPGCIPTPAYIFNGTPLHGSFLCNTGHPLENSPPLVTSGCSTDRCRVTRGQWGTQVALRT